MSSTVRETALDHISTAQPVAPLPAPEQAGIWISLPSTAIISMLLARFSSNSVEKTESETTHYNNWQTANVAFGFEFGDEKQYTVAAEVLNLFDKRYRQDDSILEPGLHANIKAFFCKYGGNCSGQGSFTMVNVSDRTDVHMRFGSVKFFFCHICNLF